MQCQWTVRQQTPSRVQIDNWVVGDSSRTVIHGTRIRVSARVCFWEQPHAFIPNESLVDFRTLKLK